MIHIIFHDKTGVTPYNPGQTGGFENAAGSGEIHYYRLFDGVGIMLLRLEMETYTEIRTQIGMIEINFCINGRFETSFSMRSHVLLKPGDMAISCYDGLHGTKSESHFPLGYYEGLCLEIDPAAAGHWIRLNAPAFPIDFTALKQNLLGSKWYMVGPAGLRCEHVFRELYESTSYAERGFLQLKVLELMLLLEKINELGTTVLVVTHEKELVPKWQRSMRCRCPTCKSCLSRSMVCQFTAISKNIIWSKQRWSWFAAGSLLQRSPSTQDMTTPASFRRLSGNDMERPRRSTAPTQMDSQNGAGKSEWSSPRPKNMLKYRAVRTNLL